MREWLYSVPLVALIGFGAWQSFGGVEAQQPPAPAPQPAPVVRSLGTVRSLDVMGSETGAAERGEDERGGFLKLSPGQLVYVDVSLDNAAPSLNVEVFRDGSLFKPVARGEMLPPAEGVRRFVIPGNLGEYAIRADDRVGDVKYQRLVVATDTPPPVVVTPDPPGPDVPTPKATATWSLILEETDELTVAQADAIEDIRASYNSGRGDSRLIVEDDDTVDSQGKVPTWLAPYLKLAGQERPYLFVVDRTSGKLLHKGPLPTSLAEFDAIQAKVSQ